jgi:lambda repressor-like predicted transcriptional regulator
MDHKPSPDADPPALDTVAARLRYALTLRGTPAHRASEAAGLSRSTARWVMDHPERFVKGDGTRGSRIEGSPSVATVAALARALAVEPAWLAFGAPYAAPVEAPQGDAAASELPAVEAPAPVPPPREPGAVFAATLDAFRPDADPPALEVLPAPSVQRAPVEAPPPAPPVEVRAPSPSVSVPAPARTQGPPPRARQREGGRADPNAVRALAARVDALRARGLSARSIAGAHGVKVSTFTDALRGAHTPTLDTFATMLAAVEAAEQRAQTAAA